jgi:AsmA protein
MKRILKIVAIVVGVLILIAVAIPFFIDANTFRPTLESNLTSVLGRQVKVGNLSLRLLAGAVSADDISIADDPAFSKSPFVQAKSLKVGVEMMPLIFSKQLNVTELTLNQPDINLVRSQNGEKWNFSSLGGNNKSATKPAASSSGNPNLSVAKLNVSDGQLTVSRAGSGEKPHVYDKVNIEVTNFSFTSSFPFTMSAQLPADGSLKLDGKAGPISANNAAETPLEAKVTIQKMNLAASGLIDPAAGIAGIADYDGTVTSDGHQAKTQGKLTATNLQLVKKGSPAGKPVTVTYTVMHDLDKQTGTIPQCEIAMGKAVSHMTGTYDAHGNVTAINLKINGQGTLATNMDISGPVDKLVTVGTVKLENSTLANFNLGSKLSAISALSGKNTGNDTTIQNFSSNVRVAPEGTKADNINLNVPAIGVVTGAGTVSPSNELAFKMNAEVGGMGIPFGVSGTSSDPKFVPDVKGIATGLLKGLSQGNPQQNPVNNVMGLFNKKKPQ